MLYYHIDVILPLPLSKTYTYRADRFVERGCRVIVPFGNKKIYSALVYACSCGEDTVEGLKSVIDILDTEPIVLPLQLSLWQWISHYYMTHLGEVMKAALPSPFRLESQTHVRRLDNVSFSKQITPSEAKILQTLSEKKNQPIFTIAKKSGVPNPIQPLRRLLERGLVAVDEEIEKDYRPQTKPFVKFCATSHNEVLEQLQTLSARSVQQKKLLQFLLNHAGESPLITYTISQSELLARSGCSLTILKQLVKKKIVAIEQKSSSIKEFDSTEEQEKELPNLTFSQKEALDAIKKSFLDNDITLLHGVTGSGKTEIYINLIAEQLSLGCQVLYLLPEIALTTQITSRLKAVLGSSLLVYHSKLSERERAEVWNSLLKDDTPKVILGVRSSLFLPFSHISLIIVDEEHDSSYKQTDPAPRYHGRNTALMLAKYSGAKVLLGSATPSVESYHWALKKKYGFVELNDRFSKVPLPRISIEDTKELRRTKQMSSKLFSPRLLSLMEERFQKNEQVIIFRNRRGFSPYLECRSCAWIPKCLHCDVNLTYHKREKLLTCHYCGANYSVVSDCRECGSESSMQEVGYGTEKVERELQEYFPHKKIARIDLDTARSKKHFERIIQDFSDGSIDVLVGTQMIAKGLDFDNVNLVGILQADSLINRPDFRAGEKSFQLLEQVAGRAGRRKEQGEVVLQTTNPNHSVLTAVCNHSYKEFFYKEIEERRLFLYPPFCRLFHIVLRAKEKEKVLCAASICAQLLRKRFGSRVLGPISPPIARVQNLHIRQIMLKIEVNLSSLEVRRCLKEIFDELQGIECAKQVLLHVDVDPV